MNKPLLVCLHISLWLIMWLIIAAIMYIVALYLYQYQRYTYIECIKDPFTLMSQLMMGWFVPYYGLEELRMRFF